MNKLKRLQEQESRGKKMTNTVGLNPDYQDPEQPEQVEQPFDLGQVEINYHAFDPTEDAREIPTVRANPEVVAVIQDKLDYDADVSEYNAAVSEYKLAYFNTMRSVARIQTVEDRVAARVAALDSLEQFIEIFFPYEPEGDFADEYLTFRADAYIKTAEEAITLSQEHQPTERKVNFLNAANRVLMSLSDFMDKDDDLSSLMYESGQKQWGIKLVANIYHMLAGLETDEAEKQALEQEATNRYEYAKKWTPPPKQAQQTPGILEGLIGLPGKVLDRIRPGG